MIISLNSDTVPIQTVERLRRQHPVAADLRIDGAGAGEHRWPAETGDVASRSTGARRPPSGSSSTPSARPYNNTVNAPKVLRRRRPDEELQRLRQRPDHGRLGLEEPLVVEHNGAPIRTSARSEPPSWALRTTRSAHSTFGGQHGQRASKMGVRSRCSSSSRSPAPTSFRRVA